MKSSITHTFTFNLIIIFIVIVFAVIAAAINYYKAFKVNTRIIYAIEKYEGYNDLAREEIRNKLEIMGYTQDPGRTCPDRGKENIPAEDNKDLPYRICVYYYPDDTNNKEKTGKYYNYSVVSYIYVDLPYVDRVEIPIHTKADRIYRFGSGS